MQTIKQRRALNKLKRDLKDFLLWWLPLTLLVGLAVYWVLNAVVWLVFSF